MLSGSWQSALVTFGIVALVAVAAVTFTSTVALGGRETSRITGDSGFIVVQQTKRTVWDRVYTDAQAKRGEEEYLKDCAPCHKKDLFGDEYAPPLVRGAFYDRWSGHSVADLYTTTRSTMPQDQPGSLPAQEYVDVIGYVLKMNEMPAGETELPTDLATLEQILIQLKPQQ